MSSRIGWQRTGSSGARARCVAVSALACLCLACGESEVVEVAFSATAASGGTSPVPGSSDASGPDAGVSGRTVWVRVLDRNATPVRGATVYALIAEETQIPALPVGVGEHRIDGLEAERVPIWVEVAGYRHAMEHPSDRPRATLVLPVGGSLEVVWGLPQLVSLPTGSLHLSIVSRLDPEVRFEVGVERDGRGEGRARIPYMAPGEYQVSLELWRVPDDEDADDVPAKILPVTEPRPFWIEEAQPTRVILGTPSEAARGGRVSP